MNASDIKAIVCDTFGTVMNWRVSVIEDFRLFGQRKAIDMNWEAFVDEWRTAYRPGMDAVRSGQWPWTKTACAPGSFRALRSTVRTSKLTWRPRKIGTSS